MRPAVCFLASLLIGCGPMGEMMQNPGQPTAATVSTTEKSIEEYQLEPYNGPQARVAVYRFGDQTAKGGGVVRGGYPGYGWYTPQIGNGMADMLNDALLQSNRFIVLDRQALKDVLQEQDLAASGRISRETAAPIGEVEGADLLIKGAITEFEPGSAGAGAGAGLGFFGLPGAVLGGVLGGMRQSHVAMIIQVVDARTSRMLFSTTVEGKANDFNLGGFLGGFGGGVGGVAGLGGWQKTPVEKAIRIAILQAVKELSNKTPKTYFRHGTEAPLATPAVTAPPPSRVTAPLVPTSVPESAQPAAPALLVTDAQRIRQAQEMLKQLGLDPGPADGVTGAKTRTAIAQFQRSKMPSKEASGRLDEPTYAALKSAVAENVKYTAPQPAPSQRPASAPAVGDLPGNVIVNVGRANLLDAPGPGGKSVGTVMQGAKLAVQADDKDSYFIMTEDGIRGWISKALTRR
jgi:curli biogenesis system outer membrane secretion channel CsgG/peptidoglycan hydrolase-like protein with peptidoglycan-binding domain